MTHHPHPDHPAHHRDNLKILALVGLSGSGKTTAVDYFTAAGFPKVYFGGVIYKAMAAAGIEKGEENEKAFRVSIRAEQGPDFAAKAIATQIHDLVGAGQHRIIADGLYTWAEYQYMKQAFPAEMTVVAVVTPKQARYDRLERRTDRPQTEAISRLRDKHEIEDLQKGGPIAAADYFVMNNGSLDDFHAQLDAIAERIGF